MIAIQTATTAELNRMLRDEHYTTYYKGLIKDELNRRRTACAT